MDNKTKVIIVGSGLFGSATTRLLRLNNIQVVLIDSEKRLAASKCSAGVFRDSWINDKIKEKSSISLSVLKEMGIIPEVLDFEEKGKTTQLFRIGPEEIILQPDISEEVTSIQVENDKRVVYTKKKTRIEADIVIVCAGSFVNEIMQNSELPIREDLYSMWGQVWILSGSKDYKNSITIWAPYRQKVLFSFRNSGKYKIYLGDGSTVKNPKGENDPRLAVVEKRLLSHVKSEGFKTHEIEAILEGNRPYISGDEFIKEHIENVYSATGGAKNSTIICGYIAKMFLEIIQNKVRK